MAGRTRTVASPLGRLHLTACDGAIRTLDWADADGSDNDGTDTSPVPSNTDTGDANEAALTRAADQLAAYFAGTLEAFDLPLLPLGTAHEQAVWRQMRTIAYGATRSYGEIASAIGSSPRAVGRACGRNPIPIIVPCHRVLAANHRIGGYSGAGGTDTKRHLLALEGAMLAV